MQKSTFFNTPATILLQQQKWEEFNTLLAEKKKYVAAAKQQHEEILQIIEAYKEEMLLSQKKTPSEVNDTLKSELEVLEELVIRMNNQEQEIAALEAEREAYLEKHSNKNKDSC